MKNMFDMEQHPLSMKQLQDNWGWYLVLGIAMTVIGMLAIAYSWVATIFSVLYLGSILVALGILEFIKAFKLNLWSNFFLHIFLGVLFVVGGIYLVVYPAINAITLTLLLSIFFIVSGFLKIIFAIATKALPHRVWLLINGIITTILGIMIWSQWPVSGLWVIGLLVGIDMLFTGWTWIMLSLLAKKSIKSEQ